MSDIVIILNLHYWFYHFSHRVKHLVKRGKTFGNTFALKCTKMRHFALAHIIHKSPASPAPSAFTAISQHFNSGAGGDWVGIVGLLYFREVSDNPFALIYHLVKHLLFFGGY